MGNGWLLNLRTSLKMQIEVGNRGRQGFIGSLYENVSNQTSSAI